jgi:shikimate dehydrogenase
MMLSGLLGRSILASRSPWLHEQEARAQGIELRYELFDFTARGLDDGAIGPLLDDLRARGFAGVNVTFPFKQAVIPLLDELADSAATVGAVNTIAMRDGRLVGHNTDMSGFRDSVREGLPGVALNHVLQFGAGGAGAAVASGLLSIDVGLLEIYDVDGSRAGGLADRLCARFGAGRAKARSADDWRTTGIDGVVNTTPMGMASAPGSPIEPDRLRSSMWVADIVYFPLETELLRTARSIGCRTLDGSGMVVRQAAAAFEIITGHVGNKQRMLESFAAVS